MISDFSLAHLTPGSTGMVKELRLHGSMRRRLLDLGLVEGTQVRCLQKSPAGDPIAYDIRGAVIALRSDDSKFVIVEEQSASLNHSFQEDK